MKPKPHRQGLAMNRYQRAFAKRHGRKCDLPVEEILRYRKMNKGLGSVAERDNAVLQAMIENNPSAGVTYNDPASIAMQDGESE
jgi:hypothetical protein